MQIKSINFWQKWPKAPHLASLEQARRQVPLSPQRALGRSGLCAKLPSAQGGFNCAWRLGLQQSHSCWAKLGCCGLSGHGGRPPPVPPAAAVLSALQMLKMTSTLLVSKRRRAVHRSRKRCQSVLPWAPSSTRRSSQHCSAEAQWRQVRTQSEVADGGAEACTCHLPQAPSPCPQPPAWHFAAPLHLRTQRQCQPEAEQCCQSGTNEWATTASQQPASCDLACWQSCLAGGCKHSSHCGPACGGAGLPAAVLSAWGAPTLPCWGLVCAESKPASGGRPVPAAAASESEGHSRPACPLA